ncbi:MAG: hypothetical protein ACR2GY_02365 [Phycisphaerales bacterium]
MPTPWIDSVKQSGQLTVYSGTGVARQWSTIISRAIREFNSLSARHQLGVTLVTSSTAPESGGGGADVNVEVANGQISFTYDGTTYAGTFNGTAMHGLTRQVARNNRMEKAFVYLPSNAKVNTPRGQRAVGQKVLELIAIHEFVHAAGLQNSDHQPDDLFQAMPQVDPGSSAAGDRVRYQPRGGRYQWMPPYVMSAATINLIKQAWS